MKPTLIATLTHGKKKTLIVAIRGTVTTDDWLLNFNGNPVTSKHLDETFQWHQGFLRVTLDKMQDHIARCVEGITTRVQGLEQIIFTGHSAGGAVAQILYALSMRASSTIARAIRGKYQHVAVFPANLGRICKRSLCDLRRASSLSTAHLTT
jgi:Mg2+ and Co2+ transporter CorA